MTDVVAVFDFPAISRFVFGTQALREIRGASALLDALNVERMGAMLEETLPGYESVFLGGGAGMFVVRGATVAEVELVLARIGRRVDEESGGGLRLASACVPLDGESEFQRAVRRAQLLCRGRRAVSTPNSPMGLSVQRECASCSSPGAARMWQDKGDAVETWLCAACLKKRNARNGGRAWFQLIERLEMADATSGEPPHDFNALGELGQREGGYVAALYFDGDAMGKALDAITTPMAYRSFSKLVDGCLREALFATAQELLEEWREHNQDSEVLPLDILLLGGDDLVMVTTAELALPFAIKITTRFSELAVASLEHSPHLQDLRGHHMTVSAGVAIFKAKQPFRVVLDQAKALLRSAKAARASSLQKEPFIDIADVSQSRFVDLGQIRAFDLDVGNNEGRPELTMWPMAASDAKRFHKSMVNLRIADVPKSRVFELGRIARSRGSIGPRTKRLIARTSDGAQRRVLVNFFDDNGMNELPWQTRNGVRRTAMLDLATFYPFEATS